MGQVTSQLSLPVGIKESLTFDCFVPGRNVQLCQYLKQLTPKLQGQDIDHWLTYIFADQGVGKSHLLYASCQWAELHGLSCVYLSLDEKDQMHPDALTALEQYDLICIDNIQHLDSSGPWQIALFDLINRIKEQGTASLVMTGDQPAALLPMQLPDLVSRLSWGTNFQLFSLTDQERQDALILRANKRGLNMSKEVAKYLVNHWQRDMPALIQSLDRLDEHSLQLQRKLTIPFVKSILGL